MHNILRELSDIRWRQGMRRCYLVDVAAHLDSIVVIESLVEKTFEFCWVDKASSNAGGDVGCAFCLACGGGHGVCGIGCHYDDNKNLLMNLITG